MRGRRCSAVLAAGRRRCSPVGRWLRATTPGRRRHRCLGECPSRFMMSIFGSTLMMLPVVSGHFGAAKSAANMSDTRPVASVVVGGRHTVRPECRVEDLAAVVPSSGPCVEEPLRTGAVAAVRFRGAAVGDHVLAVRAEQVNHSAADTVSIDDGGRLDVRREAGLDEAGDGDGVDLRPRLDGVDDVALPVRDRGLVLTEAGDVDTEDVAARGLVGAVVGFVPQRSSGVARPGSTTAG
jgi:hypothetical protein